MADKVDFGPRIGADPEFFVAREVEGKKKAVLTPICGLVGGTKDQPITFKPSDVSPHSSKKWKGFFGMQEDNVMIELNVPATGDASEFRSNLQYFMNYLGEKILKPQKLHFTYWNNRLFRHNVLEKFPQSEQIGCQPDFCAYNKPNDQMRAPFNSEQFMGRRFAGGHLHFEYNHNNVPREIFVQLLDLIGLQFLRYDTQGERRNFYGKAGIYRPKSYGVEYRTLSNFWAEPNFVSRGFLDRLASGMLQIASYANHDEMVEQLKGLYRRIPKKDLQKAIETEDAGLASEIISHCIHYSPVPLMMYNK